MQCDASKGYICEVASYAGNGDKTCSGATGAICGGPNADGEATAPFRAAGYECFYNSVTNQTGTGLCQRVEEEI